MAEPSVIFVCLASRTGFHVGDGLDIDRGGIEFFLIRKMGRTLPLLLLCAGVMTVLEMVHQLN